VFDVPKETVEYIAKYVNPLGNGCLLADYGPVRVTVHERPTVSLDVDNEYLCGNDVTKITNLTITFTGTKPYRFTLTESTVDGMITQLLTSNENVYVLQIKPLKTATYTISLLEDANCSAESNTLTASVVIYVSHITNVTSLVTTCGEDNPTAKVFFDITTLFSNGEQPEATITFLDPAYTQYNTTGKVINVAGDLNYVEFATPTDAGDYEMLITIDGCDYPFTLRVLASNNGANPLVVQRWDDVLIVNNNKETNGGYTFTSYQWYRDGVLIPGATGQYYQEVGGTSGNYSVMLTGTRNGEAVQIMTCEMYFGSRNLMRAYPIPAQVFEHITIEAGLSEEELDGAVLDIYAVTGQHLKHVKIISNTIKLEGFAVPGSYVGRITTGTQEIKSVKIVVVK